MSNKQIKVKQLREKKVDELKTALEKLKEELSQNKVAKVAGSNAQKLGRIKVLKKQIAKYNTVSDKYRGLRFKPKTLRHKKTRAIRRLLNKKQKRVRTLREEKRAKNFPLRKFALRA